MNTRFSRQELFERIGKKGQKKISDTTICIIGCGALGSNNAEILARAGVKKLVLIDDDIVELSNLQRQALYTEREVGRSKVESLKKLIKKINSNTDIEVHERRIDSSNLRLLESDIIIDGTDNLDTRFLINEYALKNSIPYIFGSAVKSEGMVYAITEGRPCLECIFLNKQSLENSDNAGIISTAIRMTSSIQCTEALKMIIGEKPAEELIRFDVWNNDFTKIKVKKNPKCEKC